MKKYARYKDCKDSVIGSIPYTWDSKPIKYLFTERGELSETGIEELLSVSEYYGVEPRATKMNEDEFVSRAETLVGYKKCYKNDLVSNIMLAWKGSMGITQYDGIVSPAYGVYVPSAEIEPKFYHYLFRTELYRALFKMKSRGIIDSRLRLYTPDFYSIMAIVPSLSEQRKIAEYLDYKTGKIDNLVSLLSDRIEDIKKYRQAVISEIVTQGLDKSAKMKDSGVDWIGEIPEWWSIVRLRFLGASQNGISKSKEFFGQGYPFVSYSDVYKNESLPQNPSGLVWSTEEERKNFSVKEGDVFFTRTSETAEEIGFSSVCEKTIENATFAGFLIRFRPNPGVLNKGFSKYFFRSDIHRWYFVNKMNIVTRASLSQDILMSMPVVLPPLSDQQAIADYLDRKTKQIDDCIAATEQRIEDLQKYRTSLIYEAVTGQIDVRDWTPNKEKNSI